MSQSDSDDQGSVTSLAEASVVRERAPEVQRGDLIAGRYQVEAIIGKGGSGIVVRAFDRTAQMPVALKILRPDLANDERWAQRFARELRLGRPIRHPNVCRIFDIGEADGHKFLTMELAAHGTLRDLIKRGGPLRPLPERIADAEAAIAGLAAIHEAGIVHRDVKPDNMLRMEDGRLALSDFGLATDLSNTGTVTVMVGTPHYMAPEIRAGEPATTRSDVWSLGVVLYEIFFGVRPERKSSKSQAGMSKPPPPLTATPTDRALLALAEACLAESPFDRPEDAREVAERFDAVRSPRGSARSHSRYWVAALGGLALLVAGGTIAVRWNGNRPHDSAVRGLTTTEPLGVPADWRKPARSLTMVPGHVHCFSLLNDKIARVVWGSPRRAEDIDLETGERGPTAIAPETYAIGCPQVSSAANSILYVGTSPSGTKEIRLAANPRGDDGKVVATGEDPVWTKSGEEFLYNIDTSHVALYSLSTMSYALLADPGLGGRQTIFEKAASAKSNTVAVLNITERSGYALTTYEGPRLEPHWTLGVPPIRSVSFDGDDRVLLTETKSASFSTAIAFDWRTGSLRHLGRYTGLELVNAQVFKDKFLIVGRERSRDAWRHHDGQRSRLTFDGENYWASATDSGALLLVKRSDDGVFSLWRQEPNGSVRQITKGPEDAAPAVTPDGRTWAYADYHRRQIIVCTGVDGPCRAVHEEDMLPVWLRFSPLGKQLAYVTQAKVPQLTVISLDGGSVRRLAGTHWECAPVWSSETTIWNLEGALGNYVWMERDAGTGAKTGRRTSVPANLDEGGCSPLDDQSASPFFSDVRIDVEERAQVFRVPMDAIPRWPN
jgi:hypothetical protein